MNIREFIIKFVSVTVFAGAVAVGLGIEAVANIGTGVEKKEILDISEKSATDKSDEMTESILEKRKREIILNDNREIPFLCDGIEYNCLYRNNTAVFYNSNQKLVLDLKIGICIYYIYDCNIGKARYDEVYLREKLSKEISSVFANSFNCRIIRAKTVFEDEKTIKFAVYLDVFSDIPIYISFRRDTGSVVLFDARGVAED